MLPIPQRWGSVCESTNVRYSRNICELEHLDFMLLLRCCETNFSTGKKKKQKKTRKQQQNQTTKTPRKITNNWFYDHPPVEIQATLPSRYCCVCGRLLLKSIERKAVLLKLWCQGVWIPKNVGRKGAAKRKLKEIVFNFLNHFICEDAGRFSCALWPKVACLIPLFFKYWGVPRVTKATQSHCHFFCCTTVSHCFSLMEV